MRDEAINMNKSHYREAEVVPTTIQKPEAENYVLALEVQKEESSIDKWLRNLVPPTVASMIEELRTHINNFVGEEIAKIEC